MVQFESLLWGLLPFVVQAPKVTSPFLAVCLSSWLSLISPQLPFFFLLVVPFTPFLSEADSLASLSVFAFNILLLPNRVLEAETGAAQTGSDHKGDAAGGPRTKQTHLDK